MLRITLAAASLVALLLVALLVMVFLVANYQTDVAIEGQARLAEGAIAIRGQHVEKTALDYGAWDDAVDHLVVALDAQWADENIGRPTFQNLGFDMAFVIAPDDRAVYGMVDGNRTNRPFEQILDGAFADLLVRQRRGDRHDPESGLVVAAGQLAIAAVAPIRKLDSLGNEHHSQHLLAVVDVLDEELVAEIGRNYLLPELEIVASKQEADVSVPLRTRQGAVVGALAWRPDRPGDALLRAAIPMWCVLTLGFGLLTALIVRQARGAARMIADSEKRATHDVLTGLPNRLHFFELLDAASRELVEGGSGFAVLYLDLDGFKAANDRHGHDAGDEVLRQVAERIKRAIDPQDVVARLGGDEFALILHARSRLADIQSIGNTLIRKISVPFQIGPHGAVSVGATVGATLAPVDGTDSLTLLRNADEALFLGKRSGKGQLRFFEAPITRMAG
ncbi:MAG: diguanylate cyclase [Rhizobiaceae bacterium]|nr:diguanylate cyclase [Rhizobiaceae bacterium]